MKIEAERFLIKVRPPELISGRLKGKRGFGAISAESIYRWIFKERTDLINYPASYRKEGKKNKRGVKRKRRVEVKQSVDIRECPEKINERKDFGRWETDLTEGSGRIYLKVTVGRKKKIVKIKKAKDKTGKESKLALLMHI